MIKLNRWFKKLKNECWHLGPQHLDLEDKVLILLNVYTVEDHYFTGKEFEKNNKNRWKKLMIKLVLFSHLFYLGIPIRRLEENESYGRYIKRHTK